MRMFRVFNSLSTYLSGTILYLLKRNIFFSDAFQMYFRTSDSSWFHLQVSFSVAHVTQLHFSCHTSGLSFLHTTTYSDTMLL